MTVQVGPDEAVYVAQAEAIRTGGLQALRDIGAEYVEEPTLQAYPSPLRWLWLSIVALTLPVSDRAWQFLAAALMGPAAYLLTHSWQTALWAAASPLTLILCRRRLQDVPVALATLLAVFAGKSHDPVWLAVVLFALLSLKEAGLLAIPAVAAAWLLSDGDWQPLAVGLSSGVAAWGAVLVLIFGTHAIDIFRTASRSHGTEYGKQHQKGAPHRLLVDLVMVSPVAVLVAVLGAGHAPVLAVSAGLIIAAHTLAPVRNVRFILAADVLLRCVAASALPVYALPVVLAIDAAITWRIRDIYDPVTAALCGAFAMPASAARK